MKYHEINGAKVIHEFVILREGWELDNFGWVTEDGEVFSTSHGGEPRYLMTGTELLGYIEEHESALAGLRKALHLKK